MVATLMYQYRLLDRTEREMLVYHWQPGGRFLGPDHPHVHIGSTLDAQLDAIECQRIDLASRHLPTGLVSLAAFARMTIEEFGVAPLRSDWRTVLARAEAVVVQGFPAKD